jgi:hypothetical protein
MKLNHLSISYEANQSSGRNETERQLKGLLHREGGGSVMREREGGEREGESSP